MKTLIISIITSLAYVGIVAASNCIVNTIQTPDGRTVVCQTCCYNGVCTTNCN